MKHTPRLPVRLALLSLAQAGSTLMSACAPLVVGGAMAGTVATVTDRRSSATQLEDQGIEVKALRPIRDIGGDAANISALSYNRHVLLTGEVPSAEVRQRIEDEIRRIDTVTHVTNDLVVMPKAPLSSRSKDALISTKVKAALIENRDVQSGVFKVYTERGTVYLLGRVTDLEGRIAVELARNVTGVERVVKMFEVITPEEARRLAPGTNPPDAPR